MSCGMDRPVSQPEVQLMLHSSVFPAYGGTLSLSLPSSVLLPMLLPIKGFNQYFRELECFSYRDPQQTLALVHYMSAAPHQWAALQQCSTATALPGSWWDAASLQWGKDVASSQDLQPSIYKKHQKRESNQQQQSQSQPNPKSQQRCRWCAPQGWGLSLGFTRRGDNHTGNVLKKGLIRSYITKEIPH